MPVLPLVAYNGTKQMETASLHKWAKDKLKPRRLSSCDSAALGTSLETQDNEGTTLGRLVAKSTAHLRCGSGQT